MRPLAAYMPPPYKDQPIIPTPVLRNELVRETLRKALIALKLSDMQMLEMSGFRELPTPPGPVRSWKAAPRDGRVGDGPVPAQRLGAGPL